MASPQLKHFTASREALQLQRAHLVSPQTWIYRLQSCMLTEKARAWSNAYALIAEDVPRRSKDPLLCLANQGTYGRKDCRLGLRISDHL